MPSFGDVISPTSPTIILWAEGNWKTPLLDISILNGSTTWNTLRWKEQNTSDETEAYVRIDILDSSNNVLLADVAGTTAGDNKEIDLSVRPTVNAQDIYINFKLFSKDSLSPIISEVVIS